MRAFSHAENRTHLCQRVPLNKHPTQLAPWLQTQHTSNVITQRQTNKWNQTSGFQLLCSAPLSQTHKHTALLSDRGRKEMNIKHMQEINLKCVISVITPLVCLKPHPIIQTHAQQHPHLVIFPQCLTQVREPSSPAACVPVHILLQTVTGMVKMVFTLSSCYGTTPEECVQKDLTNRNR